MENTLLFSTLKKRLPKYASVVIAEIANGHSELSLQYGKLSDAMRLLIASIDNPDQTANYHFFEGALVSSPKWLDIKGAPSLVSGRYVPDTAEPNSDTVRVLVTDHGVLKALELPRAALRSLLVDQLASQSPASSLLSENGSSALIVRGRLVTWWDERRVPRHGFGGSHHLRLKFDFVATHKQIALPGIEREGTDYCRITDLDGLLQIDLHDPELLALRAEALYSESMHDSQDHLRSRADEDLVRALAIEDNPDYWFQRAMFRLYPMGVGTEDDASRTARCLEYFNRVFSLNPLDSMAYYQRAIFYDDLEMHKLALADYESAIELDARHLGAYLRQGYVLMKLGADQAAIGALKTALELVPSFDDKFGNMAVQVRRPLVRAALKLGEWDVALDHIAALEKARPKIFTKLIRERARIFMLRGKMDEALLSINSAIAEAIENEEERASYYSLRAEILLRWGGSANEQMARDDLRKAAEIRVEDEETGVDEDEFDAVNSQNVKIVNHPVLTNVEQRGNDIYADLQVRREWVAEGRTISLDIPLGHTIALKLGPVMKEGTILRIKRQAFGAAGDLLLRVCIIPEAKINVPSDGQSAN